MSLTMLSKRKVCRYTQKGIYENVHSSFIHNSPTLETAQKSLNNTALNNLSYTDTMEFLKL